MPGVGGDPPRCRQAGRVPEGGRVGPHTGTSLETVVYLMSFLKWLNGPNTEESQTRTDLQSIDHHTVSEQSP